MNEMAVGEDMSEERKWTREVGRERHLCKTSSIKKFTKTLNEKKMLKDQIPVLGGSNTIMLPASATGENRKNTIKFRFVDNGDKYVLDVEKEGDLPSIVIDQEGQRSGGEWRKEAILQILCVLDCGFNVTVEVLELSKFDGGGGLKFLGRRSSKWLSKDAVQVLIIGGGIVRARVVSRLMFMGMFWIGEDSFDERSMKSVLGIFLGGFWVKELALDVMEMMLKEMFLGLINFSFGW
ncbi:hypothetical protein Tco_0336082 [Tanacetum coccineum]